MESWVEARTNFEFGENFTCELQGRTSAKIMSETVENADQMGLSSSTKVFKHCPESASHMRLRTHLST